MESRAEMSCNLKVNINCDTCRKKVMDVLQNLRGVYSVVIDAEQGTVKVSGKVNPYIILKVFEKYGKHGEVTCVKFEGEVREPIYHPHSYYYGGSGYIPYYGYGSAHPYPLMGGPDYYSWYNRHRYGPSPTAPFRPVGPPPPPRPPLPPRAPPPPPPPQPPAVSQLPPPPPKSKPVINYFPPKAPPVVDPPKEMDPEWCKIM